MDKYVRLYRDGNHYITKVLAGYEPSHDRGNTWYNAKNKILTEWDVENGVNEPHNNYTTTLLKIHDKIVLKEDGQVYIVNDSAGTFFEYRTEENYWNTKRSKYINRNGLTFEMYVEPKVDKMTTLDGVELSAEDMHNYECFKNLIAQYYPESKFQNGVAKNFLKWREAKSRLIELFRKHPKWNEQEKAIIIDTAEFGRNANKTQVREAVEDFTREIYNSYKHYTVNEAQNVRNFFSCLCSFIHNTLKTVNDRNTTFTAFSTSDSYYYRNVYDCIQRYNSKIQSMPNIENRKASKVLNEMFTAMDLDKAECYNRMFAKISDTLSIKPLPAKLVLSLNICDFVTMSHGNSWTSCHSFERKGGWHAGSISYAMDDVTIVAYGLPAGTEDTDQYKERKVFRQLFMLSDTNNSFCQSRMYPAENVYNPNMIYKYFVEALSTCVGEANPYVNVTNDKTVALRTGKGSLQYRDYTRGGEYEVYTGSGECETITIGAAGWDFAEPNRFMAMTSNITNDTYKHEQPVIFVPQAVEVTAA